MDERLSFIYGRRLSRLRVTDLPNVARAIVAFTRGHAKSEEYLRHGVAFVRLFGVGVDVNVLVSDWEKIVPALQSGQWNPAVTPVARAFAAPNAEASVADLDDPDLYRRVLQTLQLLFTEDFPTSNL